MITAIIAALAMQAATPAATDAKPSPAPTAAASAAKPAPAADDPNKPVCRRQTPVGSTIEQRVCKTKAQWDAEAANAQNFANHTINSPGAAH